MRRRTAEAADTPPPNLEAGARVVVTTERTTRIDPPPAPEAHRCRLVRVDDDGVEAFCATLNTEPEPDAVAARFGAGTFRIVPLDAAGQPDRSAATVFRIAAPLGARPPAPLAPLVSSTTRPADPILAMMVEGQRSSAQMLVAVLQGMFTAQAENTKALAAAIGSRGNPEGSGSGVKELLAVLTPILTAFATKASAGVDPVAQFRQVAEAVADLRDQGAAPESDTDKLIQAALPALIARMMPGGPAPAAAAAAPGPVSARAMVDTLSRDPAVLAEFLSLAGIDPNALSAATPAPAAQS